MLQVHDIQLVVAMHLPSNGHFWLGRVEAHCLGLVAHCEGWDTLPITSHNHLETKGESTRVQRSFPPNRWDFFMKNWSQKHWPITLQYSMTPYQAFWEEMKSRLRFWVTRLDSMRFTVQALTNHIAVFYDTIPSILGMRLGISGMRLSLYVWTHLSLRPWGYTGHVNMLSER